MSQENPDKSPMRIMGALLALTLVGSTAVLASHFNHTAGKAAPAAPKAPVTVNKPA